MAFIYNTATTLNGFLADDNNSLQWLFDVPGSADAENDMAGFLSHVGAMVMGSTTYEWILREMDLFNHPETWIDAYGARPCWVFCSRDLEVPEGLNITVINTSVVDALDLIAASALADQDIWIMGGGDLAGQFYDAGALDQIILTMAPVFLPSGKPTLPRLIDSARLGEPQVRQVGRFTEIRFVLG